MAEYFNLAPDSAPFRVLHKIYLTQHQTASTSQLQKMLKQLIGATANFRRIVLEPLIRREYIALKAGSKFEITDAGRKAIEAFPSLAPLKSTCNDTALRPFSFVDFYSKIPHRPGAFDYREIPSLMGDVRVPYRWSSTKA